MGYWLLEALAPRLGPRDRVVVAGLNGRAPSLKIDSVMLDVVDAFSVDATVKAVRPTAVLHLAAIANVKEARETPRRTWDVNLNGTFALAEAVMRHAPTARFVYVSTAEVYGDQFNLTAAPVDEYARLEPTNPYAASKAAADLLIGQLARDGLQAVRVRPFNHTGPRQRDQFVIPAFAAQIAAIERGRQQPVIQVGNLDARRDFLDVRDVVRAYVELLVGAPDLPTGLVLNLASGKARRIGDILSQLLTKAKVPIAISLDPERLRPSDTPLSVGDGRRAAKLLGWQPMTPWETTLADVLSYWRSQPA